MSDLPSSFDSASVTQRIVDLEERITFLQQTTDQLNEVVLEQQAELRTLHRELNSFRTLVENLLDLGVGDDLPDEKPPHY